MTGEPLQPWDRRPKESHRNFKAFTMYRDLGAERTTQKVSLLPGAPVARHALEQWCRIHDWVDRAAAWDVHMDRIAQEEQVEAVRLMRRNHANLAGAMISVAARRLAKLAEDDEAVANLSIPQVVNLADKGVRIERQARGEPDVKFDGAPPPQMTSAQLFELLQRNPDLAELVDRLEAVLDVEVPDHPGELDD